MSNDKGCAPICHSSFVILSSFVIRHWSFVIGADEAPQELDAGRNVSKAVVAGFLFDDQPAAVFDLFEDAQVAQPLQVAMAEGDQLAGPVGAGQARVLSMGMHD